MAHLLRFDLLATGATLLIAVVPAQESCAFLLLVLDAKVKPASFALVTLLFALLLLLVSVAKTSSARPQMQLAVPAQN